MRVVWFWWCRIYILSLRCGSILMNSIALGSKLGSAAFLACACALKARSKAPESAFRRSRAMFLITFSITSFGISDAGQLILPSNCFLIKNFHDRVCTHTWVVVTDKAIDIKLQCKVISFLWWRSNPWPILSFKNIHCSILNQLRPALPMDRKSQLVKSSLVGCREVVGDA